MVSVLAVFAALRPALRTHAEMAVRRAALASRSAAERAAVDAIGAVRREQAVLLEVETLPLLRGIADGTLDPADPAVRGSAPSMPRRCGVPWWTGRSGGRAAGRPGAGAARRPGAERAGRGPG